MGRHTRLSMRWCFKCAIVCRSLLYFAAASRDRDPARAAALLSSSSEEGRSLPLPLLSSPDDAPSDAPSDALYAESESSLRLRFFLFLRFFPSDRGVDASLMLPEPGSTCA